MGDSQAVVQDSQAVVGDSQAAVEDRQAAVGNPAPVGKLAAAGLEEGLKEAAAGWGKGPLVEGRDAALEDMPAPQEQ